MKQIFLSETKSAQFYSKDNDSLEVRGLVIIFSPSNNRRLDGNLFGGEFLVRHGFDVLSIKSSIDDWYQDVDDRFVASILEAVNLEDYSQVVGYGSSMGGYAAILLSKEFRCSRVLALSPQFSIHSDFDTRWRFYSNNISWRRHISSESLSDGCIYTLVYDPKDSDSKHIDLFRGLIPSDRLREYRLPFSGHPVTHFLSDVGVLKNFSLAVLSGDEPGQFDALKEARNRRSNSRIVLENWCEYLLLKGRLRLALSVVNQLISDDSFNFKYFSLRARVFGSLGRDQDSLDDLFAAFSIEKSSANFNLYVESLIKFNCFEKCISFLENSFSEFKHDARSNYLYGLCLFRIKRFDEALFYVDRAISISPMAAGYHRFKSEVLKALDFHSDAIKHLERAHELDPKNRNLLMMLCKSLLDRNSVGDIVSLIDRYVLRNGVDAGIYKVKIEVLIKQRRLVEVFEALDHFSSMFPNDPDLYSLYAKVSSI